MVDLSRLPYGASYERSRTKNVYDPAGRRIREEMLTVEQHASGAREVCFTEFELDAFGDVCAQRQLSVWIGGRARVTSSQWTFDAFGRSDVGYHETVNFPRGVSVLMMLRSLRPASPLLQEVESQRRVRRDAAASQPLALPAPSAAEISWRLK